MQEDPGPPIYMIAWEEILRNPKFRSMFDFLGSRLEVRRVVIESLMNMVVGAGIEYFAVETHASRVFLETTNVITFMDEDMEVEYLEHRKPLYLTFTINSVQIRRALIDIRASFNLISLSTSEAVGMFDKRISETPVKIMGFRGDT